jgi:hypothetical protein
MPIAGAFWLAVTIASVCGKKGGSYRLIGILSSLFIGGIFAGLTHLLFSGENGSTILWWVGIIASGLIALLGIWTAMMTQQETN